MVGSKQLKFKNWIQELKLEGESNPKAHCAYWIWRAGKAETYRNGRYMIVGLIPTDKGKITVDEVDITHKPVNVRCGLGVGYLPQDSIGV